MRISCRHFKGSMPCIYHKKNGVECSKECRFYSKIENKILIIKLDALGDVLRTTCILQGLKEKYRNCHITWLTRREARPLLESNNYIDCIMVYDSSTVARLLLERFSVVMNPSNDRPSAMLATIANAREKLGYGLSPIGNIYPFNKEAEYWLKLGISDTLKKKNKKSYQEIMLDMLRLKTNRFDIILNLTEEERKFGKWFAKKHKLKNFVIGINTGAGKRWDKEWGIEDTVELVKKINRLDAGVLLLGGKAESGRNKRIKSGVNVVDAGCNNTLRQFASLINLCDIVVTTDSLALHIASALKKRTIALFGPTSAAEIHGYGLLEKVVTQSKCACCYKNDCSEKPSCMELIKPEEVFEKIKKQYDICHNNSKGRKRDR